MSIKRIERLKEFCECGERADLAVVRTNDELEGKTAPSGLPYFTGGQRRLYYCKAHVPEDVAAMWNAAGDDVPGATEL